MSTEAHEFRLIGTSPIRPDAFEKVTGQAAFGADISLPGMLYGRLKTAPHAHALITRIDVSKALALPGVLAVVTAADFPHADETLVGSGPGRIARRYLIGNFMAVDKVVFYGHPVAAVAATSWHIAEDALDLIEVEYEVLPPVLTAYDAIKPDAPILHPEIRTAEPMGAPPGPPAVGSHSEPTNVATHVYGAIGDVEEAFAQADLIVEGEFHNDTAHQGYIEPHTATARWGADGRLTIWSPSQGSFAVVREPLATILEIPPSQIRVVPMEIGGGFGGKNRLYCEPIAAVLAKQTGRPVQVSMNRRQVMEATGPASGVWSWARLGAKHDGTIVAAELRLYYEAGGFPGAPVAGGINNTFGAYAIPNIKVDGYDILCNRPRNAAYRAPGVPGPTYAIESLVDELANRLGMDTMELRLKNVASEGNLRANGTRLGLTGLKQVLDTAYMSEHYRSEFGGPLHGRGVAIGSWNAGSGQHPVNATVNSDGRVILSAAAMDLGGGLRAVEAQVMAEVLGIPYEDVLPRYADTDNIGFSTISAGSGTASGISASVWHTAIQIRDRLTERAARIWEVDPSVVVYDSSTGTLSTVATETEPARTMTFRELAARQATTGGFISGHVDQGNATGAATFGIHIVDVEVDDDTGKVTVLRYTVVQDVGRVLHLKNLEGQLQGGAMQGIGMALFEEYFYAPDGTLMNGNLLDYRMPTTLDVPKIDVIPVEVPHPGHPLGVRGIGECAIVPPMAAVANAVSNALGVRMTQMPATPRIILDHLLAREGMGSGR